MSNNIREYGGIGRRFLAFIIDAFIINLITMIILYLIGIVMHVKYNQSLSLWLTLFFIPMVYGVLMEASAMQATIGKIILGLKVTDINGNRISFLRALGRNSAKFLTSLTFGIGFIMIAFTKKKQALHDLMAGCLVIKEHRFPFSKSGAAFAK